VAGGTKWDGVSLRNYAWNIRNLGGMLQVPGKRGSNIVLPGIHGEVYVPNKPYEAASGVLSMWVLGCNDDGTFPSGSRRDKMLANLRALTAMFSKPGLCKLEQETPQGWLEALVEVVAAYDFTTMAGATRAEFAIEYRIPQGFWAPSTTVNQTITVNSPGIYTFSSLSGCTAPLTDLTFALKGPATQPRLEDPVTGQWVQLLYNLPSNQTWTIKGVSSTVNTAPFVNQTIHGGGRTLLDLTPEPLGPRVNVEGVSTGATLQVVGKKRFLVPA
jgi:hypothetical protein